MAFSKISTNILHNIKNDAIATAAATAVESIKTQCSLRYFVEIKQAPIVWCELVEMRFRINSNGN